MIKVYWDSCVFIDRIQRTPGRISILEEITNAAESNEIEIITSNFTIAEVCKLDAILVPLVADQSLLIERYFDNEFIKLRQVTKAIASHAAELVRNTLGLKPPDAVHIATAIQAKVAVFQTYDGTAGKKGKLIALSKRFGTPPLPIEEPRLHGIVPTLLLPPPPPPPSGDSP